MVEEFTGNRYWQSPGNVIAPKDHPATNVPTATEHHDGTELPVDNYTRPMSTEGRQMLEDKKNYGRNDY